MTALENWLLAYIEHSQLLWVEIFFLVFAVLLLGYLVNKVILFLNRRASATATVWDDAIIEASRRPAVWLIWVVGVNLVAALAARQTGSEWYQYIQVVNKLAVILLGALFLINLVHRVEYNLVHGKRTEKPMDPTTVRAISKLARASVMITALLIAMQLLGYSVSGVLAFGGIGGLAVGFAAKDLLANFFGGLMVYLDRPFSVGDWVRSPDRNIEGTVEDIGWRLTRIRTFDKRPLYIPNAVFATIALENPSRMSHRRINEVVGVRYDDIAVVPAIVADIKAMLADHADIDQSQTIIVNFDGFGPSSLDIFVYTFTRTTDWVTFHRVKQDVLLKIAEVIAGHGAEIAFPTTTVHLVKGQAEPEIPTEDSAR